MCGIFCVVNDKNSRAAQTVLAGLKKLEYRGYDSWGIAIRPGKNRKLLMEKHVGKIGSARTTLPGGTVAIGHTRWATHGGVTDVNAHPHFACGTHIAVLHNGIVENYQELKTRLISRGHRFLSETDSEVIAHLVEEELKTAPLEKGVRRAFSQLVGSNAIAVLEEKTGTVMACRNGSPLVAGIGDREYFLASDVTALLDRTNRVVFLEDGESVLLKPAGLHLFDTAAGKEKKPDIRTIEWTAEDAQKNGYPHFLLKEIMEEKLIIPRAGAANRETIDVLAPLMARKKVVLIGCGTAYYCSLAATYLFAQYGIASRAWGAYELEPFAPELGSDTLLFAVSQSGETADTLLAVKEAKKRGARIVAVVNARGSTLERLADYILSVQAGPEIAVVSTKAFSAQLASLLALAQASAGKGGGKDRFGKDLQQWLGEALQEKVLALARQIMDHDHAFVIGKYLNYPAALEFALKMKETSYMHAEAFSSGELKHGVLTLVQKGTPCIVLTSHDRVLGEVLSSAMELRSRGGLIIGVGPEKAAEFDVWIETPDSGPEYSLFYNVIVGQLLGYYLGIGRGADPDKPRNLAKSVTVK